jgi:hypothetical protein
MRFWVHEEQCIPAFLAAGPGCDFGVNRSARTWTTTEYYDSLGMLQHDICVTLGTIWWKVPGCVCSYLAHAEGVHPYGAVFLQLMTSPFNINDQALQSFVCFESHRLARSPCSKVSRISPFHDAATTSEVPDDTRLLTQNPLPPYNASTGRFCQKY